MNLEKMELSVLDGVKAGVLKPRETFPPNSSSPNPVMVLRRPTLLTVWLMRSEMPWVGLAARTVVTVAGCVPWFLGEGNRNMNSSVQRF